MAKPTVAIALSGGMDSAVAAALLLEAGYHLTAYYMELPLTDEAEKASQAEAMASSLSIPFKRIDLRQDFRNQVIAYFTASYFQGLTPNPCMRCNQHIKFGLLAQAMWRSGVDAIATGHYVRIVDHGAGPMLARGADPRKDQSYFLARLSQQQLQGVLFPLGGWHKSEVRLRARALGLPLPQGESQDVCFLDQELSTFLSAQGLSATSGDIVSACGKRLGCHQGIWRYTIGQRRGLGLPDSSPWYVAAIDSKKNQLIVAKQEALLQETCTVHSLQWIARPPELPWRGTLLLRSLHRAADGTLTMSGLDTAKIHFNSPQRAITPGQFAVFYQNDLVLGSAIIGQDNDV